MNQEVLDDEQREILNHTLYASFGKRVLASLIDGLIFIPIYYIADYNYNSWKLFSLDLFLTIFIPVVYKIIMEWKYSGTIGKLVLKLRVLDYELRPISFIQSLKRFSIYFLSYFFSVMSTITVFYHPQFYQVSGEAMEFLFEDDVYLVYLMAMLLSNIFTVSFVFFTKKKQALHDLIAQTYCVNQSEWLNLKQLDEILEDKPIE